jgi:glycosyltransferase involved in cell wall biosynthesis
MGARDMKVSIITAVYNRCDTISNAIGSVLSQSYPDIEYIVIDGMSDDGTHRVVGRYSDRISTYVREKDSGIYDALNKGLRLATGEVVGFLHADDFFSGSQVVARIAEEFQSDRQLMGTYGDLNYVDSKDPSRLVRRWISGVYDLKNFRYGWMPPHPTVYLRRACYEGYGFFREDFGSAADYEIMLRMMYFGRIPIAYIPEILVCMRTGGASNASILNRIKANRQDARAWTVNGTRPPWALRVLKPLRKLSQFFRSTG